MNFTWFASAYDTDDVLYRVTALVQIAGGLMLAAGIPRAFDGQDFTIVTFGYVTMRVGLVANWLRAARSDPAHRPTALRYAIGLVACQFGWLALLALPARQWAFGFLLMAPAELAVPVWAERARRTSWHAHHIVERYGLFTIIVIGESVLAATLAIQATVDAGDVSGRLAGLIVGGLLLLFSMWWIYFCPAAHRHLVSSRSAFVWGYGHLVIFASTAAVGAGIAVSVDFVQGRAHVSQWIANLTVAVPVALYIVSVWAIHIRPVDRDRSWTIAFPAAAALVLLASASAWAVLLIGAIVAALVAVTGVGERTRESTWS
jgi:low temperature requirement protein LtrA